MTVTQYINITHTARLPAPRQLKQELPVTDAIAATVVAARQTIQNILAGQDPRLLVVVGPCSIHDPAAGLEYARRLAELADKVKDRMVIIMRVYFEKPRTTVGWKGLINDPHLNDTFDIAEGLRTARHILSEVSTLGLPAATEMLEPITPQYIADLVSLGSIGARTTESPTHRQMASGLSMPVGFKNGTDGSLQVALDAMQAARSGHAFLGIDNEGATCIIYTKGNLWGHLILRGGRSGPNYSPQALKIADEKLAAAGLCRRLVVDCSHANSNKDYRRQPAVWNDLIDQRLAADGDGESGLVGLMLESNLKAGRQDLAADPGALEYGLSITDACLGWEETQTILLQAHEKLGAIL